MLVVLLALVLVTLPVACGEEPGEDAPAPGPASPSPASPSPSPSPTEEAPDFSRISGPATVAAFGDYGTSLAGWQDAVSRIRDVRITSTEDGHRQPALWLSPSGEGDQPLLVVLHSWSSTYLQHLNIPLARWADRNGWGMIAPNFRGINETPQAMGSDLAVQDVIDAVDYAASQADIDEDRVFLIGFSGGGMMSLLMAGRHPDRFAGVVSWVPIHDINDWYVYNRDQQPDRAYARQIRAACGGDPANNSGARRSCEQRSPSTHLGAAREAGTPVYIAHGLNDDIVPPIHAVRAYNQLVDPDDRIEQSVRDSVRGNQLTSGQRGSIEADVFFRGPDPDPLFARSSGDVTLVLFRGQHDMVYNPGLEWMWKRAYGP
jgi:predicted esterase